MIALIDKKECDLSFPIVLGERLWNYDAARRQIFAGSGKILTRQQKYIHDYRMEELGYSFTPSILHTEFCRMGEALA